MLGNSPATVQTMWYYSVEFSAAILEPKLEVPQSCYDACYTNYTSIACSLTDNTYPHFRELLTSAEFDCNRFGASEIACAHWSPFCLSIFVHDSGKKRKRSVTNGLMDFNTSLNEVHTHTHVTCTCPPPSTAAAAFSRAASLTTTPLTCLHWDGFWVLKYHMNTQCYTHMHMHTYTAAEAAAARSRTASSAAAHSTSHIFTLRRIWLLDGGRAHEVLRSVAGARKKHGLSRGGQTRGLKDCSTGTCAYIHMFLVLKCVEHARKKGRLARGGHTRGHKACNTGTYMSRCVVLAGMQLRTKLQHRCD